jgi:hypothetical protein
LSIGHRVPPGKGRGHRLQNLVGLTGATHPSQRGRRAGSPAAAAILVSEVSQRLRQTRFDGGERRANQPAHVGDRGSSFRFRPPRGRCRWRARAWLRCRSLAPMPFLWSPNTCTTPCGISPVVTMRHNPMSSFRASATTIFVLRAPVSTLPKDMKACRKAHSVLTIGNSHVFRRWAARKRGAARRRAARRRAIPDSSAGRAIDS